MLKLTGQDGIHIADVMPILNDLDQGILHHLAWFKQLHRALVCDMPPSADDLAEDAHERCLFGRWFRVGNGHPVLGDLPAFRTIGELHDGMHDLARQLLVLKQKGISLACEDYDTFMERAIAFKLAIRHLQYEIVRGVCVVDHLTGAWNRHGMYSRLTEEQERMLRSGDPCSLCMLDLDHFKDVNDKFGHLAGDEVLRASVHILQEGLRKYDSVFRYGGEEFLICMPRTPLDQAEAILDRLRLKLETTPIAVPDGREVRITASFGVAPMRLGMEIQEVLEAADYALLCAKSKGRNRVCVWGQ